MFSRLTKSEVFPGDFNGLPQIWRFNQPFFPAFSDLVSQKIFRCFISAVGSLVAHLACESPCPPKTYCTQRLSGFGCSLWNTHRYGVGCFWGAKYIRLVRSGDNLSSSDLKAHAQRDDCWKFGLFGFVLEPIIHRWIQVSTIRKCPWIDMFRCK